MGVTVRLYLNFDGKQILLKALHKKVENKMKKMLRNKVGF